MKRTPLTLSILLILFAGGCSQEPTELERCMERYTPKLTNQEIEKINDRCYVIGASALSLNKSELSNKTAMKNRFDKCYAKDEEEILQRIRKSKILKDIRAEKFCNSQGIY